MLPPFLFPSFPKFPPSGTPHHDNGSSNGDKGARQWISIHKGKEPRQEKVGPIPMVTPNHEHNKDSLKDGAWRIFCGLLKHETAIARGMLSPQIFLIDSVIPKLLKNKDIEGKLGVYVPC